MDLIPPSLVILYLTAGAIAGTISGLFGIGGGLIMVPALVYSFELADIDSQLQLHLAVSTSMAVIVVNAASAAYTHYKKGNVLLPAFIRLVPGTMIGATVGVWLLQQTSAGALQWLFILFLTCVSIHMLINQQPIARKHLPSPAVAFVGAGGIGSVSAMLGIGGGSFFVPWLCWSSVTPKKAIGTSSLLGVPLALMAVLSNIFGTGHKDIIPLAFGYIYLPALIAMLVTGPLFAWLGARLATRLPSFLLKSMFALFLLLIAADFLLRKIL